MMPKRLVPPSLKALSAAAGLAACATLALYTSSSSESLLRGSFDIALQTAPIEKAPGTKQAQISGSEDFWLSAMRDGDVAPLTKTVAIGDSISMRLAGHDRTFEVSAVDEFAPQVTYIESGRDVPRLVLVTALDKANAAGKPIRFLIELDQTAASIAGVARGRAL